MMRNFLGQFEEDGDVLFLLAIIASLVAATWLFIQGTAIVATELPDRISLMLSVSQAVLLLFFAFLILDVLWVFDPPYARFWHASENYLGRYLALFAVNLAAYLVADFPRMPIDSEAKLHFIWVATLIASMGIATSLYFAYYRGLFIIRIASTVVPLAVAVFFMLIGSAGVTSFLESPTTSMPYILSLGGVLFIALWSGIYAFIHCHTDYDTVKWYDYVTIFTFFTNIGLVIYLRDIDVKYSIFPFLATVLTGMVLTSTILKIFALRMYYSYNPMLQPD